MAPVVQARDFSPGSLTYVFGGSMNIGGTTDPQVYREFLMAGIFAQTVTFATAGAGAGIADDMHKGLIDRFQIGRAHV